MKFFFYIGALLLFAGSLSGCGGDDAVYDPIKQQEDFQKFLDGVDGIEYDSRLAREHYIYKVTLPAENRGEQVRSGDNVSIHYAGYTFSASGGSGTDRDRYGRSGVFTTNILDYALQLGLNIDENNKDDYGPTSITIGDGRLPEGFNLGLPGSYVRDTVLLYLSADYAYGKDPMGLLLRGTPVIYEIIIEQKN